MGARLRWALACLLLALAGQAAGQTPAAGSAPDCSGAHRIRLRTPVALEPSERAALRALGPLRVTSVNAPPLSRYDAPRAAYAGVATDLLCFIAGQLGLRVEFVPALELTVPQKIQRVQEGQLDVFVPLSYTPERDRQGLFSVPFHESHYAVVARKGARLPIEHTVDLANHRVGLVGGVALLPLLQGIVPQERLRVFEQTVGPGGLFAALRQGDIDLAVFNHDFFIEERYRQEWFDLEVVHRLREFPREYRFYFSRSPRHERIVAAFDRYLAAADVSESLAAHEQGERQLIDRYVAQRSRSLLLQAAVVVTAVLALAAYATLRRHQRLVRELDDSRRQGLEQQRQLQQANQELERRSQTDGLTGLANRRHFDQVLAREHARQLRTGAPLSLLLLDVDHFKEVNDRLGHSMGDDYLRALARTLSTHAARATDLAARYGGEEFACLLPDTDSRQAAALAERIRAGVAQLDLPSGRGDGTPLTVSIGVATLVGGRHGAERLVEEADAQLYAAKHAGRNCVRAAVLA